jgi:hypothetical protein
MNTKANIGRWTSMLALAAACAGAGAQAPGSESLVWIENESFGFDTCNAPAASPTGDEVIAAIASLRARAADDIDTALRFGGVQMDNQQFMTMTPLSGALACANGSTHITFRIAAVDRRSGKFWSADMDVSTDATQPRAAVARLGDDLARHFKGVQYKAASL